MLPDQSSSSSMIAAEKLESHSGEMWPLKPSVIDLHGCVSVFCMFVCFVLQCKRFCMSFTDKYTIFCFLDLFFLSVSLIAAVFNTLLFSANAHISFSRLLNCTLFWSSNKRFCLQQSGLQVAVGKRGSAPLRSRKGKKRKSKGFPRRPGITFQSQSKLRAGVYFPTNFPERNPSPSSLPPRLHLHFLYCHVLFEHEDLFGAEWQESWRTTTRRRYSMTPIHSHCCFLICLQLTFVFPHLDEDHLHLWDKISFPLHAPSSFPSATFTWTLLRIRRRNFKVHCPSIRTLTWIFYWFKGSLTQWRTAVLRKCKKMTFGVGVKEETYATF